MQTVGSDRANILAIRLDNLGDVLMCEPALRALKTGIPGGKLTLLATPNGSRAAALMPYVDDVMVRSVVWQDVPGKMPLDVAREWRLIEDIRERSFDTAVIFTSFSQSPYPPAYVCYLAQIPRRIGQSKEFGGSLLTTWVRVGSDATHQIDRNLRLIEAMGLNVEDRDMRLSIPLEARTTLSKKLAALGVGPGQDFIVVHATASCSARTYSWSRFAEVASALMETHPVVLTGTQKEVPVVEQIVQTVGSDRVVSLCGQTSVAELVALVDEASLLVTNLTSTTHVASATRTPTVVLFAGTEMESQWMPRGCPSVLLRRPTACSPCYRFDCPTGHECLDITSDEVVDACLGLLRQAGPHRKGRGEHLVR